MKLFIEKKKSEKKDGSGKEYLMLNVDLGYRVATITFDSAIMSELADMTIRQLNALQVGDKIIVGDIVQKQG